jgi:hypothetical protein
MFNAIALKIIAVKYSLLNTFQGLLDHRTILSTIFINSATVRCTDHSIVPLVVTCFANILYILYYILGLGQLHISANVPAVPH